MTELTGHPVPLDGVADRFAYDETNFRRILGVRVSVAESSGCQRMHHEVPLCRTDTAVYGDSKVCRARHPVTSRKHGASILRQVTQ